MARPGTRWLLMSILLVQLPGSLSSPGPPWFPSPPRCRIHCEDYERVNCEWDPDPDPDPSTNYTIYWTSAHDNKTGQVMAFNGEASIDLPDIQSHRELSVWIRSENQYGSATSNVTSFNISDITENIRKRQVPEVTNHSAEPDGTVETEWKFLCESSDSGRRCEAKHRMVGHGWPKGVEEFQVLYTIEGTQPYTRYEIQARCICPGYCSDWSDWSPPYPVESAEAAPLGQLDVWKDCGTSSRTSECVLMWKRLSRQQARGHILGYEVKLSYGESKEALVNVSTSKSRPDHRLKCDSMHCHLIQDPNNWLTGVSAAAVSAYNTWGRTTPTVLTLPLPGMENDKLSLDLKMDSKTMSVFWNPSSQLGDDLKEYVLQYKQADLPPSQGFNWLRVNKTETRATLTCQFKNCTPYQVSLFAISKNGGIHHISSATGYALQGVPPKVSSFRVADIGSTSVTLTWEPIPLLQRKGVIRFYQVGVEGHKAVHDVNETQQLGNGSFVFTLRGLSPAEHYQLWMRAVSEAGPGANATATFKTKDKEPYSTNYFLIIVIGVLGLAAFLSFFLRRVGAFRCCFEKFPDPRNSKLFYDFKHQFNDWAWICVPVSEAHLEISPVEVVVEEDQPQENIQGQTEEVVGHQQATSRLQRWTEEVVGRPQSTSRLQGRTTEEVVGHPQTDPHLQGHTEEVVLCSQVDTEKDRQGEAAVRKLEWWERPERRAGFRREEYSKMVDSDEEKEAVEEERQECSSSSEDDASSSGYERHFMPTASEVLKV